MAKLLSNPCCHSSSTTFSCFHNESLYSSRKLTPSPTLGHFSKWAPKNFARIQLRSDFQLRSSNGYPLNAVSLQDGSVVNPLAEEAIFSESAEGNSTLSITIVGASGDLAKKKIFPALFALYYEDCLPENFVVFGYSRTKMNDEELRDMISRTLTCRIDKRSIQFRGTLFRIGLQIKGKRGGTIFLWFSCLHTCII